MVTTDTTSEIGAVDVRQHVTEADLDNRVTPVSGGQSSKRQNEQRSNSEPAATHAPDKCIPQQESEVTTSENATVEHRSWIRLWDTFP